jgi:preprotein translocase subunit SecA
VVFDYLKDKVACGAAAARCSCACRRLAARARPRSRTLLRGLHFAIVDEADSIFIDEARTPLILSVQAEPDGEADTYAPGAALAGGTAAGAGLLPARRRPRASCTSPTTAATPWPTLCADLGPAWQARQAREHLVRRRCARCTCSTATSSTSSRTARCMIVDEQTGRVMPGRTWEQGLHQMIETKEGVALSDRVRTVARITYQRFFRRYLRLAGMTGTAREVRAELWRVYRLHTVAVPTHRPCLRRLDCRRAACPTTHRAGRRWRDAVQQQLRGGAAAGAGGHALGARLAGAAEPAADRARHPHRLLNALQDADEAALVASAPAKPAW